MASDEQRVRTMAGWIGVEISRSRVRTPGKAGYGLYRVRAAAERHWHVPHPKVGPDGEWTPYAFTLAEIEVAVRESVLKGEPAGPGSLKFWTADRTKLTWAVATHWTPAYRGRRDLGLTMLAPGEVDRATYERLGGPLVDLLNGSPTVPSDRLTEERSTVRSRQREQNARFQAEHLERRAYGLQARQRTKLGNNPIRQDGV